MAGMASGTVMFYLAGRVAELVDALDLGSSGDEPCGFKSRPAHQIVFV